MTATPKPLTFVVMALLAGCGTAADVSTTGAAPATTDAKSTPTGETAAPPTQTVDGVTVQTLSSGLKHPWSLAFLPDGGMLVTERTGQLQRLGASGERQATIANLPAVFAEGQGGLLEVTLSPDFRQDSTIFLSYAEPGDGNTAGTAVARGKLVEDQLTDVEIIFRQSPKIESRHHFGSRLVFAPSGELFITMGDRGQRPTAQDLGSHMGTVARIAPDGSVPSDNPFVGQEGALPETWSYGHRNQQGAAIHPETGALWTHEHGPKGGDEINRPVAGGNYGWPIVTYGIDYSGRPISEAEGTEKEGMQPPLHHWPVSPGISGMAFHRHAAYPQWNKSLFVGALAQRQLIRLQLDENDTVMDEQRLLASLNHRVRDVRVGPDGAVYVLTDDIDGRLLRITPAD